MRSSRSAPRQRGSIARELLTEVNLADLDDNDGD